MESSFCSTWKNHRGSNSFKDLRCREFLVRNLNESAIRRNCSPELDAGFWDWKLFTTVTARRPLALAAERASDSDDKAATRELSQMPPPARLLTQDPA